jgi:NTP pyrophosphatase (non-canonical NTP hydrolase)
LSFVQPADYTEFVDRLRIYPQKDSRQGLTYTVLALNGEAGELANKLKKVIGHSAPFDRDDLIDELGDVLWYLVATGLELGVDLYGLFEVNMSKLIERHPDKAGGGTS